jgi:hypothetical protein
MRAMRKMRCARSMAADAASSEQNFRKSWGTTAPPAGPERGYDRRARGRRELTRARRPGHRTRTRHAPPGGRRVDWALRDHPQHRRDREYTGYWSSPRYSLPCPLTLRVFRHREKRQWAWCGVRGSRRCYSESRQSRRQRHSAGIAHRTPRLPTPPRSGVEKSGLPARSARHSRPAPRTSRPPPPAVLDC